MCQKGRCWKQVRVPLASAITKSCHRPCPVLQINNIETYTSNLYSMFCLLPALFYGRGSWCSSLAISGIGMWLLGRAGTHCHQHCGRSQPGNQLKQQAHKSYIWKWNLESVTTTIQACYCAYTIAHIWLFNIIKIASCSIVDQPLSLSFSLSFSLVWVPNHNYVQ